MPETRTLDDDTAGKGGNAGVNKWKARAQQVISDRELDNNYRISAGKKQKQSGSRSSANEQIHTNESESIAIEKESKVRDHLHMYWTDYALHAQRSSTRATGYQIDVDARSDHLERDTPVSSKYYKSKWLTDAADRWISAGTWVMMTLWMWSKNSVEGNWTKPV